MVRQLSGNPTNQDLTRFPPVAVSEPMSVAARGYGRPPRDAEHGTGGLSYSFNTLPSDKLIRTVLPQRVL
jgi:hypothetical protein